MVTGKIKRIGLVFAAALMCLALGACSGETDPNAPPKTYPYSPGEAFTTNIKNATNKKFVKADVVIEVTDQKLIDTMTNNNHVVRDVIVNVLRDQTEESLSEPDCLTKIGERIKENLNTALRVKSVYAVYFNDFVSQ